MRLVGGRLSGSRNLAVDALYREQVPPAFVFVQAKATVAGQLPGFNGAVFQVNTASHLLDVCQLSGMLFFL